MNTQTPLQKLQHNLHTVAVGEMVKPYTANLEPYEIYSPAEAVDVIAQFHSYADVEHHKKVLWRMFNLAITNERTPEFREDYIKELTMEFEFLTALVSATNSLYC